MEADRTVPRIEDASTGPGRDSSERIAWGALLVRMFLILLPGLVVGSLLGNLVVSATGMLPDHPQLSHLVSVLAGALTGLALGLLMSPRPSQLRTHVIVSAGFGLMVLEVLLGLAALRAAGGLHLSLSGLALGALLTVGPQTLLAWALWRARARRP